MVRKHFCGKDTHKYKEKYMQVPSYVFSYIFKCTAPLGLQIWLSAVNNLLCPRITILCKLYHIFCALCTNYPNLVRVSRRTSNINHPAISTQGTTYCVTGKVSAKLDLSVGLITKAGVGFRWGVSVFNTRNCRGHHDGGE